MNIFVDEISPMAPEDEAVSVKVSMNTLKGEPLGQTSDVSVRLYLRKDEIKSLSLQQIHELAVEKSFQTLKRFEVERHSANVRSGF